MDTWVKNTQIWLNTTYGGIDGWVTLDENGLTGWNTIYGLRRGLQHELGISPVSSGFGPATTAAFTAQIGTINASTISHSPAILATLQRRSVCRSTASAPGSSISASQHQSSRAWPNAKRIPTVTEAAICAHAYAKFLTSPHR